MLQVESITMLVAVFCMFCCEHISFAIGLKEERISGSVVASVHCRMVCTGMCLPAIMIVMGSFVAFVLIALYLPIFSLADTIR